MSMINLSIGFDMANRSDPAGMCVLYTDENKVAHIQNMVLEEKAELIYRLLTTPASDYILLHMGDEVQINFKK